MLNEKQKWILFYVFIIAFLVITALTIWGVFFGLENLEKSDKNMLFSALLLEIIGAVILLFKTGFSIKGNHDSARTIWLDFDAENDVRRFVGKDVSISPRSEDGNPIGDDISNKILKDRGLYIAPNLPEGTENVFITLELQEEVFEGSFSVKSYVVKLEEQEL